MIKMVRVFITNREKGDRLYNKIFSIVGEHRTSEKEYEENGYYVVELKNVTETAINELKKVRGIITVIPE
jgi:hypothetical protein